MGLNPDSRAVHFTWEFIATIFRLVGAYGILQTKRREARPEPGPPCPRPTLGAQPSKGLPPACPDVGAVTEAPPLLAATAAQA